MSDVFSSEVSRHPRYIYVFSFQYNPIPIVPEHIRESIKVGSCSVSKKLEEVNVLFLVKPAVGVNVSSIERWTTVFVHQPLPLTHNIEAKVIKGRSIGCTQVNRSSLASRSTEAVSKRQWQFLECHKLFRVPYINKSNELHFRNEKVAISIRINESFPAIV